MRFLVDAQRPPALARWLIHAGHVAEHVQDCGMGAASDRTIWDHAVKVGATIITKDEDFSRRRHLASQGPSVIWIRLPNTRRTTLLLWFEKAFPDILVAVEKGEVLVEII